MRSYILYTSLVFWFILILIFLLPSIIIENPPFKIVFTCEAIASILLSFNLVIYKSKTNIYDNYIDGIYIDQFIRRLSKKMIFLSILTLGIFVYSISHLAILGNPDDVETLNHKYYIINEAKDRQEIPHTLYSTIVQAKAQLFLSAMLLTNCISLILTSTIDKEIK